MELTTRIIGKIRRAIREAKLGPFLNAVIPRHADSFNGPSALHFVRLDLEKQQENWTSAREAK
jgi:hypothetical protein